MGINLKSIIIVVGVVVTVVGLVIDNAKVAVVGNSICIGAILFT